MVHFCTRKEKNTERVLSEQHGADHSEFNQRSDIEGLQCGDEIGNAAKTKQLGGRVAVLCPSLSSRRRSAARGSRRLAAK